MSWTAILLSSCPPVSSMLRPPGILPNLHRGLKQVAFFNRTSASLGNLVDAYVVHDWNAAAEQAAAISVSAAAVNSTLYRLNRINRRRKLYGMPTVRCVNIASNWLITSIALSLKRYTNIDNSLDTVNHQTKCCHSFGYPDILKNVIVANFQWSQNILWTFNIVIK